MKLSSCPHWFDALNVLEKEWRQSAFERGENPDPMIETLLRDAGRLSPDRKSDLVERLNEIGSATGG